MRVLVDTGAEVSIVRRGLFSVDAEEPARVPVALETVSGERMGGGDHTIRLTLCLYATDCGENRVGYQHKMEDDFYLGDIEEDVILSYEFMERNKIAVVPHRGCMLLEHEEG